ncbi:MAG TPA: UV DNA damage repair endonuclease UvsE [Bacillota bacterium]|nr:UV DNA damage repair endonuclease UvsE [Bacillota bacterium]
MNIRLGYVANALRLEKSTPSGTVTYKTVCKLTDYTDQIGLLTRVARKNLENTLRILQDNSFDRIQVYRFTSKLVPLCTHPDFSNWDYCSDLAAEFGKVGDFVKENRMRVSLHPDHFTLLNSPEPEVITASLRDLDYHTHILEAMGLDFSAKMVIHVGGKYQDRQQAIHRFREQFFRLPDRIKQRLTLENDDRCFTAAEVLKLTQELQIPMVLDIHHHQILNNGEALEAILPEVFATWKEIPPKVHISSPRDAKNPRYHADFVSVATVENFIRLTESLGRDFDIMLEAKQKDLALLKLVEELRERGFELPDNGRIIL